MPNALENSDGMTVCTHHRMVIGIPVYNEERFVGDAIRSVLAQTDTDFAVLIADNASTDRTGAICRELIAGDPRFHYIRHETNRGAAGNFQFILEEADSPFFMWLGSHDMISPGYIAAHLDALQRDPRAALSYSQTIWIDEDSARIGQTNASGLTRLRGSPIRRYLASIPILKECTAINNIIRRDAAAGLRIHPVMGMDHVFLSHLLFRGFAHLANDVHYIRRSLVRPGNTQAERITSDATLAVGYVDTVKLYRDDFEALPPPSPRAWYRLQFEAALSRKFRPERWPDRRLHIRINRWRRKRRGKGGPFGAR